MGELPVVPGTKRHKLRWKGNECPGQGGGCGECARVHYEQTQTVREGVGGPCKQAIELSADVLGNVKFVKVGRCRLTL